MSRFTASPVVNDFFEFRIVYPLIFEESVRFNILVVTEQAYQYTNKTISLEEGGTITVGTITFSKILLRRLEIDKKMYLLLISQFYCLKTVLIKIPALFLKERQLPHVEIAPNIAQKLPLNLKYCNYKHCFQMSADHFNYETRNCKDFIYTVEKGPQFGEIIKRTVHGDVAVVKSGNFTCKDIKEKRQVLWH